MLIAKIETLGLQILVLLVGIMVESLCFRSLKGSGLVGGQEEERSFRVETKDGEDDD